MALSPQPVAIPTGVPIKLNGATPLTAPPGTPISFALAADNVGSDFSLLFQAVGTLTTLTVSLQASLDGGTTWNDLVVSGSFLTTAAPLLRVTPVVVGALYRLNITVLTGSQDFWVTSN